MEKTIKWEANEASQMQAIDNDKTRALAQIGMLMMDLETAKKNLESVNDRYKAAIQQALVARGIGPVDSARPVPGGVILTLSDNTGPTLVNGPGGN